MATARKKPAEPAAVEAAPEEAIEPREHVDLAVFVVNGVNVATIPVTLQSTQERTIAIARQELRNVSETAEIEFYTLDPEA